MELHTCAVAGHRPTRFKWKYKENNNGCKRLKKRMHDQFIVLYEKGVRRFYITSAIGVHMWAGELALQLKSQPGYEDIELATVLPFPDYNTQWDIKSRKRMETLIRCCVECITLGKSASQESYVLTNRYLVDHSQFLIAVSEHTDDSFQDLTQMESYAEQKDLCIIFLHPDTAEARGVF